MAPDRDRDRKPSRPAGPPTPTRLRRVPGRVLERGAKGRQRRRAETPRGIRLTVARGDERFEFEDRLPLLPLRDVVIFPYMTMPLLVGIAVGRAENPKAAAGEYAAAIAKLAEGWRAGGAG